MNRICSLLLSVAIIATTIYCPMAKSSVYAATKQTTSNDVCIENTFDEADWNPLPNSNLLKEEITDGSNGNALRFNKVTSFSATTGNAIRHYNIFNPQKVDGGYVDYRPTSDTTYKLTFRYRTKSLLSNNIFINVRSVANDTVGDVLCRAVTIKKSLNLSGENEKYVWDSAVAYFKTPSTALDALAISVEWNGAADSSGAFDVAIDDVKLEIAPANFVLVNTFEEDDVTTTITDGAYTGTINSGTDPLIFKSGDYNANETGYDTSVGTNNSKNAYSLRANGTLGFRAARIATNSKKVHYEIYSFLHLP